MGTAARRSVAVALVVAAWLTAAVWAPPAAAATALSVTPSTNLVSGQVVRLDGSGFTPNSNLAFCQAKPSDTPSSSDCGSNFVQVTASPTGTFTAQLQVHRFIFGRTRDCAVQACVIGAAEVDDIEGTVAVAPISFDPTAPVPLPDARLKNRATGEIYGNDVYASAGVLTSQRHAIQPGGAWSFAVQIENDGPTDSIDLVADVSVSPFTVRYFAGYY